MSEICAGCTVIRLHGRLHGSRQLKISGADFPAVVELHTCTPQGGIDKIAIHFGHGIKLISLRYQV